MMIYKSQIKYIFQSCLYILFICLAVFLIGCGKGQKKSYPKSGLKEAPLSITSTEVRWYPEIDIRSDLVLIRFQPDSTSFYNLFESWEEQNYNTGVVSVTNREGENGKYRNSYKKTNDKDFSTKSYQFQENRGGIKPEHPDGGYYVIPDSSRINTFKTRLRQWIENDIQTIVFEVPEYLASTGYSPFFQSYWEQQTDSTWHDPVDSTALWYQAAELKSKLLSNFIQEVITFGKKVSNEKNKSVKFLISSPSSVSSAVQNKIIPGTPSCSFPEIDGLIGTLSGGTYSSFTHQGRSLVRPFVSAYLDYSWFVNCIDQSKRGLFLSLPSIPEAQEIDWSTFRHRYFSAAVAGLMQPSINKFQLISNLESFFQSNNSTNSFVNRKGPRFRRFAKQLGALAYVIESLDQQHRYRVSWHGYPWPKTGVVFSDTYMWQRGSPWSSKMESFYFLATSLIQHGVPVQVVPLEKLDNRSYLNQYDVLLMSYEVNRPQKSVYHDNIHHWINRKGGILIFYIGLSNAFDEVEGWWSDQYYRPHEELFDRMQAGMYPEAGVHKIGEGTIYAEQSSPLELSKMSESSDIIWNTYLYNLDFMYRDSLLFETEDRLFMRRGPYQIVFIPDEPPEPSPFSFDGHYLDLFSDDISVIRNKKMVQGDFGLFLDLNHFPKDTTVLVLSTSRIQQVQQDSINFRFVSRWAKDIPCITYVRMPSRPERITCVNQDGENLSFNKTWISDHNLLRIESTSTAQSVQYEIRMH